jgi:hypothetical protein
VTWPTFPTFPDYSSTVARAVEAITALSTIYGGAGPGQSAVPRWANIELILELLVPCPISLAIRTSM